jgi:hypothetical protein
LTPLVLLPPDYLLHNRSRRPALCHSTIADHSGSRKNCADNPNCLYGLGERKRGIWTDKGAILAAIGSDPAAAAREPSLIPAGMKNLGATCYLNSLVQSLFHNLLFRAAVYAWRPHPPEYIATEEVTDLNASGHSTGSAIELHTASPSTGRGSSSSADSNAGSAGSAGAAAASGSAAAPASALSPARSVVTDPLSTAKLSPADLTSTPSRSQPHQHQASRFTLSAREAEDARLDMRALQSLFARMQFSALRAVDTHDFVKRFEIEAGYQQDAQEFNKMLLNHVEHIFSRSPHLDPALRHCIPDLFRGVVRHQTRCLKCGYLSSRDEAFYELELVIQGHTTVEQCMQKLFHRELMTQDNQYLCSGCNAKQDAERFLSIESLPPVLNLQLLRFVYDAVAGNKKKLKDAISIPDVVDLTAIAASAGQRIGNDATASASSSSAADVATIDPFKHAVYELTAVLYHKGSSAHHGHYVADVWDSERCVWWAFDDGEVEPVRETTKDGERSGVVAHIGSASGPLPALFASAASGKGSDAAVEIDIGSDDGAAKPASAVKASASKKEKEKEEKGKDKEKDAATAEKPKQGRGRPRAQSASAVRDLASATDSDGDVAAVLESPTSPRRATRRSGRVAADPAAEAREEADAALARMLQEQERRKAPIAVSFDAFVGNGSAKPKRGRPFKKRVEKVEDEHNDDAEEAEVDDGAVEMVDDDAADSKKEDADDSDYEEDSKKKPRRSGRSPRASTRKSPVSAAKPRARSATTNTRPITDMFSASSSQPSRPKRSRAQSDVAIDIADDDDAEEQDVVRPTAAKRSRVAKASDDSVAVDVDGGDAAPSHKTKSSDGRVSPAQSVTFDDEANTSQAATAASAGSRPTSQADAAPTTAAAATTQSYKTPVKPPLAPRQQSSLMKLTSPDGARSARLQPLSAPFNPSSPSAVPVLAQLHTAAAVVAVLSPLTADDSKEMEDVKPKDGPAEPANASVVKIPDSAPPTPTHTAAAACAAPAVASPRANSRKQAAAAAAVASAPPPLALQNSFGDAPCFRLSQSSTTAASIEHVVRQQEVEGGAPVLSPTAAMPEVRLIPLDLNEPQQPLGRPGVHPVETRMPEGVWNARRSHAALRSGTGSRNAYMLVYTRVSEERLKEWKEWPELAAQGMQMAMRGSISLPPAASAVETAPSPVEQAAGKEVTSSDAATSKPAEAVEAVEDESPTAGRKRKRSASATKAEATESKDSKEQEVAQPKNKRAKTADPKPAKTEEQPAKLPAASPSTKAAAPAPAPPASSIVQLPSLMPPPADVYAAPVRYFQQKSELYAQLAAAAEADQRARASPRNGQTRPQQRPERAEIQLPVLGEIVLPSADHLLGLHGETQRLRVTAAAWRSEYQRRLAEVARRKLLYAALFLDAKHQPFVKDTDKSLGHAPKQSEPVAPSSSAAKGRKNRRVVSVISDSEAEGGAETAMVDAAAAPAKHADWSLTDPRAQDAAYFLLPVAWLRNWVCGQSMQDEDKAEEQAKNAKKAAAAASKAAAAAEKALLSGKPIPLADVVPSKVSSVDLTGTAEPSASKSSAAVEVSDMSDDRPLPVHEPKSGVQPKPEPSPTGDAVSAAALKLSGELPVDAAPAETAAAVKEVKKEALDHEEGGSSDIVVTSVTVAVADDGPSDFATRPPLHTFDDALALKAILASCGALKLSDLASSAVQSSLNAKLAVAPESMYLFKRVSPRVFWSIVNDTFPADAVVDEQAVLGFKAAAQEKEKKESSAAGGAKGKGKDAKEKEKEKEAKDDKPAATKSRGKPGGGSKQAAVTVDVDTADNAMDIVDDDSGADADAKSVAVKSPAPKASTAAQARSAAAAREASLLATAARALPPRPIPVDFVLCSLNFTSPELESQYVDKCRSGFEQEDRAQDRIDLLGATDLKDEEAKSIIEEGTEAGETGPWSYWLDKAIVARLISGYKERLRILSGKAPASASADGGGGGSSSTGAANPTSAGAASHQASITSFFEPKSNLDEPAPAPVAAPTAGGSSTVDLAADDEEKDDDAAGPAAAAALQDALARAAALRNAVIDDPRKCLPAEGSDLNTELRCPHGKMTHAKKDRKRVRAEVWEFVHTLYPNTREFPADGFAAAEPCAECRAEADEAKASAFEDRAERRTETTGALSSVIAHKRRTTGFPTQGTQVDVVRSGPLGPGTFYLLPAQWLDRWRNWIDGEIADRPTAHPLPWGQLYCECCAPGANGATVELDSDEKAASSSAPPAGPRSLKLSLRALQFLSATAPFSLAVPVDATRAQQQRSDSGLGGEGGQRKSSTRSGEKPTADDFVPIPFPMTLDELMDTALSSAEGDDDRERVQQLQAGFQAWQSVRTLGRGTSATALSLVDAGDFSSLASDIELLTPAEWQQLDFLYNFTGRQAKEKEQDGQAEDTSCKGGAPDMSPARAFKAFLGDSSSDVEVQAVHPKKESAQAIDVDSHAAEADKQQAAAASGVLPPRLRIIPVVDAMHMRGAGPTDETVAPVSSLIVTGAHTGKADGDGAGVSASTRGHFTWALDPPICAACWAKDVTKALTKAVSYENSAITLCQLGASEPVPGAELASGGTGGGGSGKGAAEGEARPRRQRTRTGKSSHTVFVSSDDVMSQVRMLLYQEGEDAGLTSEFYYGGRRIDGNPTLATVGVRAGDTIYYRPSQGGAVDVTDAYIEVAESLSSARRAKGSSGNGSSGGGGGPSERGFSGSRFVSSAPSAAGNKRPSIKTTSTTSEGEATTVDADDDTPRVEVSKPAQGGKWSCGACTVENVATARACEMCGTRR